MIRKWDIADEQTKRTYIDEILTRIEEQDGSEFGRLAAQKNIDIVGAHLGPAVHDAAVEEANKAS